MKDVFKEKYLEYESKITLEIFTLVWNKLIELSYKSFNNATIEKGYDEFKGRYRYFRTLQEHPNEFSCYNSTGSYTETTVEEILGYNPFIKETKPSKDWSKATEEELLEEAKRRYPICCKVKLIGANIGGEFSNEVRFTKYSFYRFEERKKLFVDGNLLLFNDTVWAEIESLPEIKTKEVIPEYIECIKPQSVYFIPGNIYKVLNVDCIVSCKIISNIKCSHYEANSPLYVSLKDTSYFKPSTKEVFDAQVEKEPVRLSFYVKYCDEFTEDLLKSLMEWSQKNNTLKNRGRDNSFKGLKQDGYFLFDNFGLCSPKDKSYIDKHKYGYGVDNNPQDCFMEYSIKEVKELINYKEQKPIEKWTVGSYVVFLEDIGHVKKGHIDIIKGSLNNFNCVFLEKYLSLDISREKHGVFKWFATKPEAEEFAKTLVESGKEEVKQAVHCTTQEEWDFVKNKINRDNDWEEDYPCQILVGKMPCKSGIQFCIDEGIQILSFQEWCNLNGYKMDKKKYTIEELETNPKLIIYISSKEEHDKIQKVSKRICNYYGNCCYSLYKKTYSSSSSKSCPGAYKDLIILTIDDIIFKDNIENGDKEILNESFVDKLISFRYNNFKDLESFYEEIKFLTTEEAPKPKMILSIDDEELPMVNIIKTNSLKQLLNND